MLRLALTLPMAGLLMAAAIPPDQARPPATQDLPYTPACRQLEARPGQPGYLDWGPTVYGAFRPWYPIPDSWALSRAHAELAAAGLCVPGGATVPFMALEEPRSAEPIRTESRPQTPDAFFEDSIRLNDEAEAGGLQFDPLVLAFIAFGVWGWKQQNGYESIDQLAQRLLGDDDEKKWTREAALSGSHGVGSEQASASAPPPVYPSPEPSTHDRLSRSEPTVDGSVDAPVDGQVDAHCRRSDDWDPASADITDAVRERVLDELEAHYTCKAPLNVTGLTITEFKKGHCPQGGKFNIDTVYDDEELLNYAQAKAFQFLAEYTPHRIQFLVWWVFGLNYCGEASPRKERYDRAARFCQDCLQAWNEMPF